MKETAQYRQVPSLLRSGVRLHASRKHRVALRPNELQLLEIDDLFFGLDSAVLLPYDIDEETGKPRIEDDATMRPQGIGLLYVLLRYMKAYPDLRLLVAGHTDTSGGVRHNLALSEARARGVYLMLDGRRQAWAELIDEYSQTADVQRLLKFLAWRLESEELDPGPVDDQWGPKTRAATHFFQQVYNAAREKAGFASSPTIAVDGDIGPETWGGFFELIYQLELCNMLGCPVTGPLVEQWRDVVRYVEPARPAIGFGESFPVDEAQRDAYRSATNRRVELLLFAEEDLPALPAGPASDGCYSLAQCPFFDRSAYVRTHVDPSLLFNHSLELEAVTEAGGPAANVQLLIECSLSQEFIPMTTDANGYGRIEGKLPPGFAKVVHGETGESGCVRLRGELVPAQLRTRSQLGMAAIPEVVVEFLPEEEREEREWLRETYGPRPPKPAPRGTVTPDHENAEIGPSDGEEEAPPPPQESVERLSPVAYDNLALVANVDGPDPRHRALRATIAAWLEDHHAVVGERGFHLVVFDDTHLWCFTPKGDEAVRARLSARVDGYFGLYAPFLAPSDPVLLDAATRSRGLGGDFEDVDEDGHIRPDDMVSDAQDVESIQRFGNEYGDSIGIYYHAPSAGQVGHVALRGGSGMLEPYVDHAADRIHERNKATVRMVVSAHASRMRQYIRAVERIAEQGDVSVWEEFSKDGFGFGDAFGVSDERQEELQAEQVQQQRETRRRILALKKLGPPPSLYTFPRPPGCSEDQWDELVQLMSSHWEYRGWVAVSDGINTINQRQSEGTPYLRIKVKPKADLRTLRRPVAGDSPVAGGPYARWEVETTIDIGANGTFVKRDPIHVVGMDAEVKAVSAGGEVEVNQITGEEKTKWNVGIGNFGFEVADDGNVKVGASTGLGKVTDDWIDLRAEGEYNYMTKELGQGIVLDTEFGEVYVGLHFIGLTEENIMAYLTRAPGFFERRVVYEYFEPGLLWSALSSHEQACMTTFGWTPASWDARSRTPFEEFPDPVYSDPAQANSAIAKFLNLSPRQKWAAAQLGLTRHDWAEWRNAARPDDQ